MGRVAKTNTLRLLPFLLLFFAIVAAVLTSCEDEKHYYVKNVGTGEKTPTMNTLNVKTFISDSGYTKYMITAPIWSMFEEAKDPFWLFPKGIELEQYDHNLKPVASMRCDSARYFSQRRLWKLDGHVMMVNTNRDTFLTKQLYWDQNKREVYSDSFMHIVHEKRIIEGMGFTSNERMTAYTVRKPMGIFPITKDPTKADPAKPQPEEEDEYYDHSSNRRTAPPRASSRSIFMQPPPMRVGEPPQNPDGRPRQVPNGPIVVN